nr:hypothetical protein [Tanacetum cinerariifolium]
MVTRFHDGTNRPTQHLNLHVSSISPLPKSYIDAFNDTNWQNATYLADGTLSRYKARFVANGSTQIEVLMLMRLLAQLLNQGRQTSFAACTSRTYTSEKAQQLEPKLYDGNFIEKTNAIVIRESKETLMLAEESRFKMILKQKDHMMSEKKVNTTPIDYAVLN